MLLQEVPFEPLFYLFDHSALVAGDLHFVLARAGGPAEAEDVGGVFFGAEAGEDFGGGLAEVAGGAGNFEELLARTGENFDRRKSGMTSNLSLRSNTRLTVCGSLQARAPERLRLPRAACEEGWCERVGRYCAQTRKTFFVLADWR